MSFQLVHYLVVLLLVSIARSQEGLKIPDQYSFIEADLVDVDLHKMVGKWTLRASTTKQQVYSHNIFQLEGERLKATKFHGENVLGTALLSHVNNSKALDVSVEANGQQEIRIVMMLYMDAQYFIQTVYGFQQNQIHLKVYARPEAEFDAEYVMELIYNHLLANPNVRQLIQSLVYNLQFMNSQLTDFLPNAPRHMEENELAQFSLDQLTGIFDLRYATDEENVFEYVICSLENDVLRVNKIKGTQLIVKTTQYKVPDSRRIFKVYKPVTQMAPNVRSVPSVVDYLYVDNNTFVTYEFCAFNNKEYIRVYARQGHSVSAQFNSVPSTVLFKVRELMSKLKAHYETKDQNIALEYQVINQYASIDDSIEQVNLKKLEGNWTLRASNSIRKEPLFTHKVFTINEQGVMGFVKYNGAQQLGSFTVNPIIGSKVLKSVGDDQSLSLIYVLYLDDNYGVFFWVRAHLPGRPTWFKIYARDRVPFDTEYELQLVLRNVYSSPELKQLLGNIVYDLDFVNDKLTDFWPQPYRSFDENELAQFEWNQVTGVFDLRYTSDPSHLAIPFDFVINSQSCVESRWGQLKDLSSFMKSFRMKATEIKQNVTEIRVPGTRRIVKVASTPPRYNPNLITKPYGVDYLYVDDNIYLVYEFCGFDPVQEHVRLYVRQGFALSQDQTRAIIEKIPQTAVEKINHLISHLRPHHHSQDVHINKLVGSWSLQQRWPGHILGDVRSMQIVDNKVVMTIFNKGIETDQLVYSPMNKTNMWTFNSTNTGGHGLLTMAYTDDQRMMFVVDGSAGFNVNVYGRLERKLVLTIRIA